MDMCSRSLCNAPFKITTCKSVWFSTVSKVLCTPSCVEKNRAMLSTSFPKDKKKTVLHLQNARRTAFFVITILNQYESRSNVLTENP